VTEKAENGEKEAQVGIREVADEIAKFKEDDWRGVLAFMVVIGGLSLVGIAMLAIPESLKDIIIFANGIIMVALSWYYRNKEEKA